MLIDIFFLLYTLAMNWGWINIELTVRIGFCTFECWCQNNSSCHSFYQNGGLRISDHQRRCSRWPLGEWGRQACFRRSCLHWNLRNWTSIQLNLFLLFHIFNYGFCPHHLFIHHRPIFDLNSKILLSSISNRPSKLLPFLFIIL